MNEVQKPNDIFVSTVLNPESSLLELSQAGVTPDNTGFLSIDDYKNTNFVKKSFTDDKGNFNNDAFQKAYVMAADNYKALTDKSYVKNLEKNVEYNPNSRFKPVGAKEQDLSVGLQLVKNPYHTKKGISSMYGETPSNLSIRELAQDSKIFDTTAGKFIDKSANDLGLFGSMFNKDTLVYAQYDTDGEHIDSDSGRKVSHKKGEYKIDPTGNFYTETLGGREVYGKEIVSSLDLLTKDNGFLNSVDFLDSDGKQKSAWGTTFKIAAKIAPYLISYKGFNNVYGGISAAVGLASAMPVLYKSIEGIISGEDDVTKQSGAWNFANKAEGFTGRFSGSTSDEGKKSMANYEQIGSMVGSVFGQIYEQRAMAGLSNLFKSTSLSKTEAAEMAKFQAKFIGKLQALEVEGKVVDAAKLYKDAVALNPMMKAIGAKQSQLAKSLSLGYMALTTSTDIYAAAINGGYDRRTAGLAFLTASAGQYGIMMNNKMSTWFLDKSVGFSEETNKALTRKALMPILEQVSQGVKLLETSPEVGRNALKKAMLAGKNAMKNVFTEASSGGLRGYWEVSLIEGVEEVTEQMVMDATKGTIDVLSELGVTKKKGSFGGFDNVFSKAGLENYISNLVGGMVGGPMFKFNQNVIEPMFSGNVTQPEDNYTMYSLVANGKTDEALAMVENMRGYIGNKFLATGTTEVDGKQIFNSAGKAQTQADLIIDGTKEYIKTLDSIFNQEGLKIDDASLFNKALLNQYMLPELEKSGVDKLIISDFNKLAGEIVQLRSQLKGLESTTESADGGVGITETRAKLEEKRLQIQELMNGDKSDDYLMKSLLYLIPEMHKPFISLNKEQFTQANYGKSYADLDNEGIGITKKSVTEKFDDYIKNPDIVENLDTVLGAYKNAQGLFSNVIKDYSEGKYKDVRSNAFKTLYNLHGQLNLTENFKNNELAFREISKSANAANLKNFSISDMFDYDVNQYLETEGLINKNINIEEGKDQIADKYQTLASQVPMQNMNVPFLTDMVKDFFTNIINEGNNKEYLEQTKPENIRTASPEAIEFRNNFDAMEAKYYKPLVKSVNPLNKLDFQLKMLVDALSSNKIEVVDNEILKGINKKLNVAFNDNKKDLLNGFKEPSITTNYGDLKFDYILGVISDATIKTPGEYQYNSADKINSKIEEKLAEGLTHSEAVDEVKQDLIKYISDKFKSEIDPLSENDEIFSEIALEQKQIVKYINDQFKLNEVFDKFNKYISKKASVANPLYDFLRNLQIKMDKGVSKSVFDILEEEDKLLSMSVIDDYLKSDFTIGQINSAISTIEMAKAIVTGMYTKQGEILNGKETLYGFNYAMQNYLKKYKESTGLENYATIEATDASLVTADLNNLLSKLTFIKELSNSNSESKAKEHILSRDNMNKLFVDFLSKEEFTYNGRPLITDKESILNSDLTTEAKLIKMEDSIFDNFKLVAPADYPTALEEIFKNVNFNSVFNGNSDGISSNVQTISQYDAFISILTNLAVKSTEVQERNRRVIDSPEFTYAPFYGQEYSAKIALALIKNSKLFSDAQDLVYRKINPENASVKQGAFNIVTITGVAGSGKTSVVGQFILKYLLQDNPKSSIIISSPTETQTKGLRDSLVKTFSEEEAKKINQSTKTTAEIINRFLKIDLASFNDEVKKVSFGNNKSYTFFTETIVNGNSTLSLNDEKIGFKFVTKSDVPSAIFLDEGTHYNTLELQLFNKISKQFGFPFVIFGDKTQNGAMIDNNSFNLDRIFTLNSPVLTSSIRASNVHKHDNNFKLALASDNVIKAINLDSGIDPNIDKANAVKKLDELDITLNYFQDENTLTGDKIVSSITDEDLNCIKNALVKSLVNNPTAKLGIITANGEIDDDLVSQLAKVGILPSQYVFYSSSNTGVNPMQGMQEEFMIVDKPLLINANNRIETFFQDLNTVGSRAFQASLILDKDGTLEKYNIKNKKEDYNSERHLGDKVITDVKALRDQDFENMGIKAYITPTNIVPPAKNPNPVVKPVVTNEVQAKLETLENETIIDNSLIVSEVKKTDLGGIEENLTDEEKRNNLMIHAFYNHLSVPTNEQGQLVQLVGNENLQLLSEHNGDLFDSSLVNTFIEFKNVLSLYYDNEPTLRKLLIGDSTKESKFTDLLKKLGITDVESFISSIKDNVKVVGNRYNSSNDDPRFKAGFDSSKTLQGSGHAGDDLFMRLALKLNLENKTGYITIGALPTKKTLDINVKDAEAIKLFNDMVDTINKDLETNDSNENTTVKNPIIELAFDGNAKRKFTSGVRFINMDSNVSADSLETMHPDIKIETTTINGIETIPMFGGLNVYKSDQPIEELILKYGYNRDPNTKISPKVLQSYRARPYIIVSFSDEAGTEFKKLLVLTPKKRNFEELYNEFTEIRNNLYDKEEKFENVNNNYSFNVSKLFSKYTGFEMFYNIKKSNAGGMDTLVALLKDQVAKFYVGNDSKISKINGELDDLNKFNTTSEFTSYIKQNVKTFPEFNVGQIILTVLSNMEKSTDKEMLANQIDTIKNSLLTVNGKEAEYSYNGRPYSLGTTEDILAISTDDLKYFETNTIPEMPRYVVNFDNIMLERKPMIVPVVDTDLISNDTNEVIPEDNNEKSAFIMDTVKTSLDNSLNNQLQTALTDRFNIEDVDDYNSKSMTNSFMARTDLGDNLYKIIERLNVVDGKFQPTGETPIEEVLKDVKDTYEAYLTPMLTEIKEYQKSNDVEVKDARLRKVKMDLINQLTLDLKLKEC